MIKKFSFELIFGISCLTLLGVTAMYTHTNSGILQLIIGSISAIVGAATGAIVSISTIEKQLDKLNDLATNHKS